MEHFLEGLSLRDDVLVLSGRCYERESVRHKALDGVVDFLSRYLAQLSPAEIRELVPEDAVLLADLFPVLGVLVLPTTVRSILDPHERRKRAVAAFRGCCPGSPGSCASSSASTTFNGATWTALC